MSAGHIDWHQDEMNCIKVYSILDDSLRKILVGGEPTINTENNIKVIGQMVERYWIICPMRELIIDHGVEFGAHRREKKGE